MARKKPSMGIVARNSGQRRYRAGVVYEGCGELDRGEELVAVLEMIFFSMNQ